VIAIFLPRFNLSPGSNPAEVCIVTKPFLSQPLETSAAYLQKAAAERAQRGARLRDQVQTVGLRLLADLLNRVAADLDRAELAETALVYDVLTGQLAEITGRTPDDVFPALIQLCQDPVAWPLIQGKPVPPPASVEALRGVVLRIRTTYESLPGASPNRQIELIHRNGTQALKHTITHKLEWDDLPDDVRAQLFTSAAPQVAYQLYPRPAENPDRS
jgi:hypothetical protein